jgi:hypothetical protein
VVAANPADPSRAIASAVTASGASAIGVTATGATAKGAAAKGAAKGTSANWAPANGPPAPNGQPANEPTATGSTVTGSTVKGAERGTKGASKVAAGGAAATAPSAPTQEAAAHPLRCAELQGCTEACGSGAPPSCAEACAQRLVAEARPTYEALQACVKPACADPADAPCRTPGSFGCKMCVLAHCSAQASACMRH